MDARQRVERRRVAIGPAVVDEAQVAVAVRGEQRFGFADVDLTAQELRGLARLWIGLQSAVEVVEQQGHCA